MRASTILVLVALIGAVLAQGPPQPTLYPTTADGFETVWLTDMSFVNEITVQTVGGPNFTDVSFFIYGDSRIRTVYTGRSYSVGATPNENWHLPFIDLHTFNNGSDIWGIGPVNAIYGRNRTDSYGFQFEIAVVSTAQIPGSNRNRTFLEQPVGFEGTFYTVRLVGFDPNNVIGYFCGFFPPNASDSNQLYFGVRRAHFNISVFQTVYDPFTSVAWTSNPAIDDAVMYHNAQLVAYNSDFKPMLLHARNINPNTPNVTYLVIVDPYGNRAALVTGNYDQTVPLTVTGFGYIPTWYNFGRIVSAVIYNDLLLVGVSAPGQFTGWIDILHVSNLTQISPPIVLPGNFSDPRALVLDYFAPTPTLYVGMNGGWAVLKIDLTSFKIVGFQSLPFYLHRTWRGIATHEHIYFVTNEQHSKVYRMFKGDFCPTLCMENGYCQNGKCVCNQYTELKGGKCEWKTLVVEKHKVTKEKGGEVALGIFFAISFVAACAGWYMVWKNKRGYQSVA